MVIWSNFVNWTNNNGPQEGKQPIVNYVFVKCAIARYKDCQKSYQSDLEVTYVAI